MLRTSRLSRWTAAALFVLLAFAGNLVAQEAPLSAPDRHELREQLTPIYEQVKADSTYWSFWDQLKGNLDNQELVDRYLTYLPISPKAMLEIEMKQRRTEVIIPRLIFEWHLRWIELHPTVAREHYGTEYVDRVLKGPTGLEGLEAEREAELEADGARRPIAERVSVGTNRNVATTYTDTPEDYQGEIQVVANPNNPLELVAGANTWDNIPGTCAGDTQAVFYSSDGGASWAYTCTPDDSAYAGMSCAGAVFGSDPALAWNHQDEVFMNHMLLCYTGSVDYAMVVAKSSDGGATWTGQGIVKNSWGTSLVEDKNFYAIDTYRASPYFGRHYTCWGRNNNEKMAYSSDNGATWTEVDLPTTPSTGGGGAFDLACELEVEDNGTVHVVYDTLRCFSSCNNEQMFYSKSTNGGVTWSAPQLIADFNLVSFAAAGANCPAVQDERCINPFGSIAVDNSGGICDGTLYVTYSDWTSGGAANNDVWVINSTDGGATWSAPVKVNDDGLAGRTQFHPFLVMDQSQGWPVVGWHDARNDPANRRVDYYVSRSFNCGTSFQPNTQASQPSPEFNNSTISYSNENTIANPPGNPNQYGEYLGIDATCGNAYLAWTDTRHFFPGSPAESQKENVGFVAVDFDVCHDGKGEGRWNLPVAPSSGGASGTLYNVMGVPQYTIKVRLIETAPGEGKVVGEIHGICPRRSYRVEGTYKVTTSPLGVFEAKIFPIGGTSSVGVISGGFKDDPLATSVGSWEAKWEICP